MTYDLVIRNGVVVDGSGLPGFRADVGVVGDTIATIGRIREPGDREIDAEGHTVTPGFVDGHTHMDAQVMWDPLGTPSSWHGVTTAVMGNCGFTLAPVRRGFEAHVVKNLERAEDISAAAMAEGIDWSWEGFPGYLDAVEARPKAINYACYVGHSALRTWAMGERAFTEEAGDDDLAAMCRHLEESLRAGAVGVTTSRNVQHCTPEGDPVASRLATWAEVECLVDTVASTGSGLFELAHEPGGYSADPDVRAEYFDRLRALAVHSGVPVTFGLSAVAPLCYDMLAMADATEAQGGRMIGQSHSRGISAVLSFRTNLPFDRLPSWAPIRALPLDEQLDKLADPEVRTRLVDAASTEDYPSPIGAEPPLPDFDRMYVLTSGLPPYPRVSDRARELGVDPVELIIDLAVASGFDQFFIQDLQRHTDEDLLAVMRHPRTAMTFSDSGAHVSQIIDASIHSHLLGYWVRQREEIRLEDAVRMMTLAPARAWGFSDRGLLREGMRADLNVIDMATIAPSLPEVVFDLPAGAVRLAQRATGLRATVVNGVQTVADSEHTGDTPGRLIRNRPTSSAVRCP
jgi:N-acyl-D-amino-acid deacylase